MIGRWVSNLKTDEEKEKFNNQLLGSKTVLRRLQEMIQQEEDSLEVKSLSKELYDSPNWACLQADINGSRRMAKTIINLINLDQKENG